MGKKKHLIVGRLGKLGAFIGAPARMVKDAVNANIEFDRQCADVMARTGCTSEEARAKVIEEQK